MGKRARDPTPQRGGNASSPSAEPTLSPSMPVVAMQLRKSTSPLIAPAESGRASNSDANGSSKPFALPPSSEEAAALSSSAHSAPISSWDVSCVKAILKQTRLDVLRDAAVYTWLRDACEWLQDVASCPEIRFQVLTVMSTIPWWRYWSSPDKLSRNHTRTFFYFEKLSLLLLNMSPHMVRGVVDVALKPLHTSLAAVHAIDPSTSTSSNGSLVLRLPLRCIARILNHAAVKYPQVVPGVLFRECIEPLMPQRRWPHAEHHLGMVEVLLSLALDASLPPQAGASSTSRGLQGIDGNGNDGVVLAKRSSAAHVSPLVVDALHDVATERGGDSSDATSRTATSTPCSLYDSGAELSASSTSAVVPSSRQHRSGSSGVDDVVQISGLSQLMQQGSTTSVSASGISDTLMSSPHNNRLMVHSGALVSLCLKHLLDMELSLTTAVTRDSGVHGHIIQDALDRDCYKTLVACLNVLQDRLASDMQAQLEAGAIGAVPSWWKEMLNFHVNFILSVSSPLVLHTLAPRLALHGSGVEAADLVHRLVTTVLKGIAPSSHANQLSSSGNRNVARAQQRVLPMFAPQLLPTEQRVTAAKHIAPLIRRLVAPSSTSSSAAASVQQAPSCDVSVATGAIRRMQKWLAAEASSRSGAQSLTTPLMDVVFAQVVALCKAYDMPLQSDVAEEHSRELVAAVKRTPQHAVPQGSDTVGEGDDDNLDALVECCIGKGSLVLSLYNSF